MVTMLSCHLACVVLLVHSRVDTWRHRGGMSCACPGRLEVSRGIVEAKHVTTGRHPSPAVDLTNTNSCQLKSTHMTPTNCSRITSAGDGLYRTCVRTVLQLVESTTVQSVLDPTCCPITIARAGLHTAL